jgi:hypothetical protein
MHHDDRSGSAVKLRLKNGRNGAMHELVPKPATIPDCHAKMLTEEIKAPTP